MEWIKLTDAEVREFITLYGPIEPGVNLRDQADRLFTYLLGIGNFSVPEAVADLYIAAHINKSSSKYNINQLTRRRLSKMAKILGITSPARVIRILRYSNQLEEPDKMTDLPEDLRYVIALELDLPSVLQFCGSSRLIRDICQSDKYWRERSIREFSLSKYNDLLSKSQDPQLVYLSLVAKNDRRALLLTSDRKPQHLTKFGSIDYMYRYKNHWLVVFYQEASGQAAKQYLT